MEEGTIIEWVAQPGDVVKSGDVLLILGTDKVDAEVEAEGEGRFEPVVATGATLPPGALIAWLLQGDEQPPEHPPTGRCPPRQLPRPGTSASCSSPARRHPHRPWGVPRRPPRAGGCWPRRTPSGSLPSTASTSHRCAAPVRAGGSSRRTSRRPSPLR